MPPTNNTYPAALTVLESWQCYSTIGFACCLANNVQAANVFRKEIDQSKSPRVQLQRLDRKLAMGAQALVRECRRLGSTANVLCVHRQMGLCSPTPFDLYGGPSRLLI